MLDKSYLTPTDALAMVLDSVRDYAAASERLKIEECYGRIVSAQIISDEDLPGFARSTVDGFAVRSVDTYGAKETLPAYITLKGEVFMGEKPLLEVAAGEAAKIPTGGMLPAGADSVVMLEHVQAVSDSMIEVMKSVSVGENVIQRDEDIKKDAVVMRRGHKLRAQDIGALAGIGITEADVFRKPVVSLISTGDEIVPPYMPVNPGQVRDINSFTLAGLVAEEGGIAVKKGILKDDYDTIRSAVESALQDSDMVLIIGGTSAGTRDMTAQIIGDIGHPGVLFHGIAVKPGKPLIGGLIETKPVLGLPGHPAAVVVCFDLFIRPVMRKLLGVNDENYFRKTVAAVMGKGIASAAGREDHIRVYIEKKDDGYIAYPILGKSGLITTLVKADGVVMIPGNKLGLDSGEAVTVNLF
ncbi:MAG TPA: gephyrin-like molybdotransferase Glp [Dissulfurispiraceae bacterium]|nr:gephyrin-like molybdotransferase Glp [Dissulfurispiraceae bacterium]